MSYESEIRVLLGEPVYTVLLEAVDHGEIQKTAAEELAKRLHPQVWGFFIHSSNDGNFTFNRRAMSAILSSWYRTCKPTSPGKDLISALRHDDIQMFALAQKLEDLQIPQGASYTRQETDPHQTVTDKTRNLCDRVGGKHMTSRRTLQLSDAVFLSDYTPTPGLLKLVMYMLGKSNYDSIMKAVDRYHVSKGVMEDLSGSLGDRVGGNHLRRMDHPKASADRNEMNNILCDWFREELHTLSPREAVLKLKSIFKQLKVVLALRMPSNEFLKLAKKRLFATANKMKLRIIEDMTFEQFDEAVANLDTCLPEDVYVRNSQMLMWLKERKKLFSTFGPIGWIGTKPNFDPPPSTSLSVPLERDPWELVVEARRWLERQGPPGMVDHGSCYAGSSARARRAEARRARRAVAPWVAARGRPRCA